MQLESTYTHAGNLNANVFLICMNSFRQEIGENNIDSEQVSSRTDQFFLGLGPVTILLFF